MSLGFSQFRVVFDGYNVPATANTDILSSANFVLPGNINYVTSKNTPISLFVVYVSFQAASGDFSIMRTQLDGTVVPEILNPVPITKANILNTYVAPISPSEHINFRYSLSTTLNKLTILELLELS